VCGGGRWGHVCGGGEVCVWKWCGEGVLEDRGNGAVGKVGCRMR